MDINGMELTITLTNAGLAIKGPIENKLTCYGLLELAKEAIQQHHRDNARLVQPVSGPLPDSPFAR